MPSQDESTIRARIYQDLDRTEGDAAFLTAFAEFLAPVRRRVTQGGRMSVRADCARLLRRRRRSRQARRWIDWIVEEHARWREAHPAARSRPGPELLALPAVPRLTGRRTWTTADLGAILHYIEAMARRQAALASFVQARLHEYPGIHPTGWIRVEDPP